MSFHWQKCFRNQNCSRPQLRSKITGFMLNVKCIRGAFISSKKEWEKNGTEPVAPIEKR